jgi:hypothetical protein
MKFFSEHNIQEKGLKCGRIPGKNQVVFLKKIRQADSFHYLQLGWDEVTRHGQKKHLQVFIDVEDVILRACFNTQIV